MRPRSQGAALSDARARPPHPAQAAAEAAAADGDGAESAAAAAAAARGPEFDEEVAAQEEQFGPPVGQPGQWASCLRIVEPTSLSTQVRARGCHSLRAGEATRSTPCMPHLQITCSNM